MKKSLIQLFMILFAGSLLAGCDKTKEEQLNLQGSYSGTFERRGLQESRRANVTLNFDGEQWTGSGDTPNYPALCNGRFLLTVQQIQFSNACSWTGNFDNTFILNGIYKVQYNGTSLVMTRSYASGISDVYTLTKK